MRVLSLLVVLTAWCSLTKADKPNNCSKGVIKPDDPYFLDGQNITLTCWRNDDVTARDLFFTRGSLRERLPEEYHERNKTHVTLRFPVTVEDVKNFRGNSVGYYCHDKRSKKDVCIQSVYVQTDFYPVKPVDVKCSSYNWETMTCEWGLDVVYNQPEDYDVSCDFLATDNESVESELLFRLRNDTDSWDECPNQTSTSCYWDKRNYFGANLYIMMVRVKNTVLNITTSTDEVLTFRTKDIVKPAPVFPSDISTSFLDKPETIHIQWNYSKQFRDFDFMLQIESICDQEKVYEIQYIPDQRLSYNEQTPAQMDLTRLIPNTEYTVNLRARPLGGTGPWSEATEIVFTTLSDVPKGAPYTRNGLFEETSGSYCSTIEDCMNIKVYFKPLTECEIFSNTTEYRVTSPLLNTTLDVSDFWTVSEVPANQTSSIELRAISEEGVSTNYSRLTIHPEFQRPNIERDLVIHYTPTTGDCTARVKMLRADERYNNLSHIIVWCYSAGEPYCQWPIDWYELRGNETFKLPVEHCKVKYRVGFSTLGQREDTQEVVATPIHWESCMYEEGKVPEVPLPHMDTIETGVDKKVKVSWTEYSCNTKDMNYVEYYEVSHCGVAEGDHGCTCTDKLVTQNVSRPATSVTLRINDSAQYGCVWVRAKTVAGFGPKNAEGKLVNVTGGTAVASFDDERRTIIIGSVGGGLGILAIVLVCLGSRCYKRLKKMLEGPQIDDILIPDSETALQYQVIDTVKETEMTIEEKEADPLISDSGTGSLASKISTDIPETERERNGSDDSGVHRLGNVGDDEQLVALLEVNPAGTGDTYGAMPDLDEYDFDSSTGLSFTGPSMNKTKESGSETEKNFSNGADVGIAELDNSEESTFQNIQGIVDDVHKKKVVIHANQNIENENKRHSNEIVVNIESLTADPSLEGSKPCQISETLNPETVSGSKPSLPVESKLEQTEQLHDNVLAHEVNDLDDFDHTNCFVSENESDEGVLKGKQEDKLLESEDNDLHQNSSQEITNSIFHNPSQPSSLSGSKDLSFDLDGSGLSRKGGYASAINVSMDSDIDISDSETEAVRDSDMLDKESNSEIATTDLFHTNNHSSSCTSQKIQKLPQEQTGDKSEESNKKCDNLNDIPHGDIGSISNTQGKGKVSIPTSESITKKNKTSKHIDEISKSYMKVKESESGIYKSSS